MATIFVQTSAQRLSSSTIQQAPNQRPVKRSNHHHDDSALDVDEMILMHMEQEWGMREMGRYKSMRGSWPLRHRPNNNDEDESEAYSQASPVKATAIGDHSRAAILEALKDEDYFGTSLFSAVLSMLPKLNRLQLL